MKTILEYLLSNKDKGRDKRPEFPKSFITDDIITFLECNDYVEIKEPIDNIDKAYEKIQDNIKHNNIFCTLNEEYNVVIVRFCNQGEINEKNPIYCISTSKTGNIPENFVKTWKEYGGYNNVKITNNTKTCMIISPLNFFDEIKKNVLI